MKKAIKPEYIAKAKLLTKLETERLLSRMGGKLDRRLEKRKVSQEEALARQLEFEDEQLQEWRKMMHLLKEKEKAKAKAKKKAKAMGAEKAKAAAKARAPKAKVAAKIKVPLKAKVAAKAKAPLKAKVEPGK
ncbi:MAG: hypothetical protein ABI479_08780 [Gallionella sp.]